MKKVAIVTGASSGIGREFAIQIAQKYKTIDEIWLIARRKDRLAEVKAEINAVSGKLVRILSLDLTKESDIKFYRNLLERQDPSIRVLVNAAGYGIAGHFEDMTVDDVNFVNMGIPEAKAGLEGGSVDVALLAGAAAYQTQQQGYHLITDGEGLINAIIAVAVTNKFYEAHPEIIEKLQSAQAEIADFMQNHEQEAYEMAAAELDLDVDAVKEMAQYYDFSTEITAADKEGFQRTADFMYQAGMIEKELDVNTLF